MGWDGTIRRPRPPRLTWPPLRPALRASSAVHSWAVPFSCAARPPLLAISRCFSGDIEANPRRSLRTPSTALLLFKAPPRKGLPAVPAPADPPRVRAADRWAAYPAYRRDRPCRDRTALHQSPRRPPVSSTPGLQAACRDGGIGSRR